MLKFHFA